jgi:hypothetical protein
MATAIANSRAAATAITNFRAAGRLPRRAPEARVPESMECLILQNNGGDYDRTIGTADGATFARSGDLASYPHAERAAQHVRDGGASARFEHRAVSARPADLTARRSVTSDAPDAERWLDEGGSVSSEAVAKWPAPR